MHYIYSSKNIFGLLDHLLLFDFNEKSSVLLLFFLSALLFCFLLLRKGLVERQRSSLWLSLFIFLGGLYISPFMLGYAGWYSVQPYRSILFFLPLQQLFLLGPVFYIYLKILLNKEYSIGRKDVWHFVPALLYGLYSLVVFIGDVFIFEQSYFYADQRDKDLDFWYQFCGLISMLFYLGLSWKYYKEYRKLSVQEVSYADEINYQWMQHFMIVFGLILILRVLFFLLNPEWGQFGSKFWYYLCFSVLLHYISILGYMNAIRSFESLGHRFTMNSELAESKEDVLSNGGQMNLDKWVEALNYVFQEDEIYRDPNLTLSDLAEALKTNRNIISKTINQEFQMNFNDFVNSWRVKAVMESLKKGKEAQFTLLSLALDAGFNSKTTFNRAFKKQQGVTPREFLKDLELEEKV